MEPAATCGVFVDHGGSSSGVKVGGALISGAMEGGVLVVGDMAIGGVPGGVLMSGSSGKSGDSISIGGGAEAGIAAGGEATAKGCASSRRLASRIACRSFADCLPEQRDVW